MNIGCVIVARLTSKRLESKHLQTVLNRPIISFLIERVKATFGSDARVVMAVPKDGHSNALFLLCEGFEGSCDNIPYRLLQTAKHYQFDAIVCVDGDDVAKSPAAMRAVFDELKKGSSYVKTHGLPLGLDAFGLATAFLEKACKSKEKEVFETGWERIFSQPAKTLVLKSIPHTKDLRFTLDYREDLFFFRRLIESCASKYATASDDVLCRLALKKQLWKLNYKRQRDYLKNFQKEIFKENPPTATSKGPLMWKRAQKIIPGGNGLLSKRPERFIKDIWPTYYQSARGCYVRDLESREYLDFCIMGVGACVLGYGNEAVNRAVKRAVDHGNMCSLNCPEEVLLAERLLEIHPWADQARFAKGGGEACALAIRLVRAATQKTRIAFSGYHGWHDWYLAALHDDPHALDQIHLKNISSQGVPPELKGTATTFLPHDMGAIDRLDTNNLAAIIIEPKESSQYLRDLRAFCTQKNIPLIIDEITHGFRSCIGGHHTLSGIEPDMVIYGKALGNGFPISAVLGRRHLMEGALATFVSSTMWTERCGFAAALATLHEMAKIHAPQKLLHASRAVRKGLTDIAKELLLPLEIEDYEQILYWYFKSPLNDEMQRCVLEQMLLQGVLFSPRIYMSTAHGDREIEQMLKAARIAFERVLQVTHV